MEMHRHTPRHRATPVSASRRALPAVSAGAAACAVLGLTAGVGHATPLPADPRLAAQQRIFELYRQAAVQTQQYDAQQEAIARLQAAVDTADAQRAVQRQTLNSLTGGLGRLAAQQYRDPGFSSSLALLFATHPDDYLERASFGDRVAALDAQQIRALEQAQHQLQALGELGSQELQQLQEAQTQMAADRTAIRQRLPRRAASWTR